MPIIDQFIYSCPTFMVPYLINGDVSGSDIELAKQAEEIILSAVKLAGGSRYYFQVGDVQYFTYLADFIKKGCDCVDLTVYVIAD